MDCGASEAVINDGKGRTAELREVSRVEAAWRARWPMVCELQAMRKDIRESVGRSLHKSAKLAGHS